MNLFCADHSSAPRYDAVLSHEADFDGWRDAVRRLVFAGIDPRAVVWSVGGDDGGLFGEGIAATALPAPSVSEAVRTPKAFVDLARTVVCHKAPERFVLLHRLLARLAGEPQLLSIASDRDVSRAEQMAKGVRRCSHKMKAFVRFRSTTDPDSTERYVAWFEPEHHTLDLTAPFFVRRFCEMRWSILTPTRSAHWDGETLQLAGGASASLAPDGDINEELWRTYFGAIFNPARLKVKAMTAEMPKRYWKNMPEAELIAPLIKTAADRTHEMVASAPQLPARSTRVGREKAMERDEAERLGANQQHISDLGELRSALRHCERCPLYGPATQVVPGEGRIGVPLMFVGEQPGDREDLDGRPFVGPAGRLFDEALQAAQIARDDAFVTNAVKHFKFEPRGKRRIHKTPNPREIKVCGAWLDVERRLVQPRIIVALGASAARALGGRPVSVTKVRGSPFTWPDGTPGLVTVHPSYILRLQDTADKRREMEKFVTDLTRVREIMRSSQA